MEALAFSTLAPGSLPGASAIATAVTDRLQGSSAPTSSATTSKSPGRCGVAVGASLLASLAARHHVNGIARQNLTRRRARGGRGGFAVEKNSMRLAVEAVDDAELTWADTSRTAHWVLRSTDLPKSLKFYKDVFDMAVLRHEENDRPCAITCNGAFRTAWSKTMVGYGCEDENYCFELTYNYGVSEYPVGNGLEHFAVGAADPEAALKRAAELGYEVHGDVVIGPDAYKYRILAQPADRVDRFLYVALRVADIFKAEMFYRKALGMNDLTADFEQVAFNSGGTDLMRVVAHNSGDVPLYLFEDPDNLMSRVKQEEWEGRNAIAVPGKVMRKMYKSVAEDGYGGSVLHEIREFNEAPALRKLRGLPPMACEIVESHDDDVGHLAVAVIEDPDGYEICLVSSECYNLAVARAYRPDAEIDWEWRADAQAGKRRPTPQHMAACV